MWLSSMKWIISLFFYTRNAYYYSYNLNNLLLLLLITRLQNGTTNAHITIFQVFFLFWHPLTKVTYLTQIFENLGLNQNKQQIQKKKIIDLSRKFYYSCKPILTTLLVKFANIARLKMTSSESSNIFNILGLSIDVGPEQVRKRCQDLLLKLHPDKNGGVETPEYHKVKQQSWCSRLHLMWSLWAELFLILNNRMITLSKLPFLLNEVSFRKWPNGNC